MNLRDLRYIVAVADLNSFVHAAERCFISQPTLSMQIKKLEDSLGVQLFERSNKKVMVTEVGMLIVASARKILEEADNIKQLAEQAHDPLSGNLRFGAFPTLATYLLPGLVPLIKQALPRIRLILVEEKTDILLDQLKSGTIDMALLALPVADDSLQITALFDDTFFLAVNSEHAFADRPYVSQNELEGQSLLLLEEGHCLRGHALQVCQLTGAEEQQDVRATSLETLRQMVRAGTGMTFMPNIAVRPVDEGVRYIPFDSPAPKRTIALVRRKTCVREVLVAELVGLIQQAAAVKNVV
jgi:LysR family transcriptional regulator, hydrogen peroxide-inducible genes activator